MSDPRHICTSHVERQNLTMRYDGLLHTSEATVCCRFSDRNGLFNSVAYYRAFRPSIPQCLSREEAGQEKGEAFMESRSPCWLADKEL